MAETPDVFAGDLNGAFAFSEDAKREIQSILCDSAQSVMSQLQSVAANHLLDVALDYMPPAPVPEVRGILTALSRVIRCIDQASSSLRNGLSGQTLGNIDTPTDWDNLARIRRLAKGCCKTLFFGWARSGREFPEENVRGLSLELPAWPAALPRTQGLWHVPYRVVLGDPATVDPHRLPSRTRDGARTIRVHRREFERR